MRTRAILFSIELLCPLYLQEPLPLTAAVLSTPLKHPLRFTCFFHQSLSPHICLGKSRTSMAIQNAAIRPNTTATVASQGTKHFCLHCNSTLCRDCSGMSAWQLLQLYVTFMHFWATVSGLVTLYASATRDVSQFSCPSDDVHLFYLQAAAMTFVVF